MRLVTWNCCRGTYSQKVPLLEVFTPDIAVIQECGKPPIETEKCLWFGDNPHQGIAILSSGSYRLRRLPTVSNVPKYIVPVQVVGAHDFLLLAVWSKKNKQYRYIEAVVRAVEIYRSLIVTSPTVLIGDLNSNAIWDANHSSEMNHAALVRMLSQLRIVSGYHSFYREAHGQETRHTYYFHKNRRKPFHIDYCFIPESWAKRLRHVEIGLYETWKMHSDHCPLLVEINCAV